MCQTCRTHALELEHVRLGLAAPSTVRIKEALPWAQPRPVAGLIRPLAVASLGLAIACGGAHRVPCDAHDEKALAALAVERAKCSAKIQACETVECVDDAQAACDQAAAERCKE